MGIRHCPATHQSGANRNGRPASLNLCWAMQHARLDIVESAFPPEKGGRTPHPGARRVAYAPASPTYIIHTQAPDASLRVEWCAALAACRMVLAQPFAVAGGDPQALTRSKRPCTDFDPQQNHANWRRHRIRRDTASSQQRAREPLSAPVPRPADPAGPTFALAGWAR